MTERPPGVTITLDARRWSPAVGGFAGPARRLAVCPRLVTPRRARFGDSGGNARKRSVVGWHRGCDKGGRRPFQREPDSRNRLERGRHMETHMNRSWTFTSAVIVAALSVAALPAGAQGRERGGRPGGGGGQGGGGQAQQRQQAARQAAGPRQAPPAAGASAECAAASASAERAAASASAECAAAGASGRVAPVREPPYSGAQAQPRVYQSRPLPTAPQATPRTNENRQSSGAQAQPRGEASPLYSAAQPRANMNRPNQAQPRADESRPLPTAPQATPRTNENRQDSAHRRSRAGRRRLSIRPLSLART